MTIATDDAAFPSLFAHTLRKDWGVGVLAAEMDGKRRFLFEDGEERVFTPAFYQMLHRVDQPNDQQQAAYTRLRGALAKRRLKDGTAGVKAPGEAFSEQLARFLKTYPEGFSDPAWLGSVRGEGATSRTLQHRQPLLDSAREQLSPSALDSLLSAKHYAQVWEQLLAVLRPSDLVPSAQLKAKAAPGEPERVLAVAVRDLLHGTGPYYQRFDRYQAAFSAAFGQHAKWELSTAPSAIVHPKEHVCVDLTSFRSQLKVSGTNRSIATQPSSAAYTTFLGNAQLMSNKLTENGQPPRDLLDVRDFIVATLKPAGRAPAAPRQRAKAAPKKPAADVDADDSVSNDD